MPVLKGLDALRERQKAIDEARSKGFTLGGFEELRLKADTIATIRILSEKADIFTGLFHRITRPTLKGKQFTDDIYCTEPEKECQYCKSSEREISATRARIFLYVYTSEVLHREAPQNKEITEVVRQGLKFYLEKINKIQILKTGEGWGGYISSKFLNYHQMYGTLLDRSYKWVRQGSGLTNTVYDLLPEDPSTMPKEIEAQMKSLPSLEDIIKGTGQVSSQSQSVIEKSESQAQVASEMPLLDLLKSRVKK